MPSTEKDVKKFLNFLELPEVHQTLGNVGRIRGLEASESRISAQIELGFPAKRAFSGISTHITDALRSETGVNDVSVELSTAIVAHGVQRNLKPLNNIRNVIAVASGKGGVGKSTAAVNLALALAADGATVGLLDADIYGPSQPTMVGLVGEQPKSEDGKSMMPLDALGLQVMSIGFLVDQDQPMVWRGPMVTQALNQLLFQTNWRDLDYLIVDMPPGTGDIQLTLSQKVPVSGAIIVTTPQDIALADALRGLRMFEKVKIPVLGLVENMSNFVCPGCGEATPLFGDGGGVEVARQNDLPLLAKLPLDIRIRRETDEGSPTVVTEPDSPLGLAFRDLALHTVARLAQRPREYKGAFPKIVVEKT